MAKSSRNRSIAINESLGAQSETPDAVVRRVPYDQLPFEGKRPKVQFGALPRWGGGNVLGFFIVGFELKRPAGGGAVKHTLKVAGMPKGTKKFYPWLMHLDYHFVDAKTGGPVERPLWIQFTDLFAYKKGNDWYLQVTGGWADKDDVTPWQGFVGIIGIATG
jgi:hypothetical protein